MSEGVNLERLQERLDAMDLSDNDASLKAGLSRDFIRNIRRSQKNNANAIGLGRLAAVLETSVDYLLNLSSAKNVNDDTRVERPQIPVAGYVGAGATYFPIDDYPKGEASEFVDAPPGTPPGTLAVRVRGASMVPVFEDGDLIFFATHETDPRTLVNRRCVVGTADGRVMVKRLAYGSEPGLWTLTSYNAPAITDVALDWVARIVAITPRD